ncbi:serine hydrolase domain-containing protein [Paenibacillus sp. RC67]|uniref:serine hydrolase domain-containing protein n=1 Tax=Paenibacillus sp. RC67 TaxID=3039392 RepID=UPI0024AC831C|nr:serine hydrolase domain-containing protein [Paenibacillus sp. RC67]
MDAIVDALEDYLVEYERKWTLSGTVLIAHEGNIIFQKAYGYANIEHQVLNTIETKFRIWSLSKSFTALAIMMLYERNLLKLEDDIGAYLPEFANKGIAIIHLLNHTAGLVNYTSLPGYHFRLNKLELTHQDVIKQLMDKPLQFKPGASFSYTNSAYYLLGMIIEITTGLSFEEFLIRNILQPLGMDNTGIFHQRKVIPHMSSGYHSSWEQFIQCEYLNMSGMFGAGAMYSTVEDLFKWDQALYTEKLVSQAALDQVFKPTFNYGFGWFIDERYNRKRIHHSGAYRGHRSDMQRYPNEKVTIIMLTNYDFVPILKLTDRLASLVFGEKATVPNKPNRYPLRDDLYARYIGNYEGKGYDCKAVVDRNEDQLFFIFNDEAYLPFYPVSETKFHHTWYEWDCEFTIDDNGDTSFLGMKKTK